MSFEAALIGCGALGRVHTQVLSELDGIDATVFCDVDVESARGLLNEFGGRFATASVAEVIKDSEIDVVYVATQHDTHAELCISALEAGKHVVVEKPLALTWEECTRISDAVARTGMKLLVALKFRGYDLVAKARELIPEPLMVSVQGMDEPWPAGHWANDPVRGGGNVLGQGVHCTDLLRYLAGRNPVDVYAVGGNYYQSTGVVDNVAAVFRFDGNVAGAWMQGDADRPPPVGKFFAQVFDEGRSLTLTDRLTTLVYHEAGSEPVTYRGSESGFMNENRHVLAMLQDDAPPFADVGDGLWATAMVLQALASLKSGEVESVRALVDAAVEAAPVADHG